MRASQVPELVKLMRRAEKAGIRYKDRFDMYRRLGLSNEQRLAVETKVVEHISDGRIPDGYIGAIVRYNLFRLCETSRGKTVYEAEFRQVYHTRGTVKAIAATLGVYGSKVVELAGALRLEPKRGASGRRPVRSEATSGMHVKAELGVPAAKTGATMPMEMIRRAVDPQSGGAETLKRGI